MGLGASFYGPYFPNAPGPAATASPAINFLFGVPFVVPSDGTLNAITFRVTVVGGLNSVARVGIYRASAAANGYRPAALVVDGGQFDTSAIGGAGLKTTLITVPVLRGQLLWLAYLAGVAAPQIQVLGAGFHYAFGGVSAGLVWQGNYVAAFAYAALPDPFPVSALNGGNAPPLVLVKYA